MLEHVKYNNHKLNHTIILKGVKKHLKNSVTLPVELVGI